MTARIALIAGAVAACAAAFAPAASARTDVVGLESLVVGGPALSGDGVVWARASAGVDVMRSRASGGSAQKLFSRQIDSYSDEDTGEISSGGAAGFSASPAFALIDTTTTSGSSKYSQYNFTAQTDAVPTAGGTAKAVAGCSVHGDYFNGGGPAQPGPPRTRSAIDGSVAVLAGCGAPVVRDVASGEVLRTLPDLGADPRIAGRFVASASAGKIVVRDWEADAVAYEIPIDGTFAYDLEPDGTVATVRFLGAPSCANGVLRFHSPGTPEGVESAVKPCAAVVSADAGRAAVVTAGPDGDQVIAAVGADGSRTDLARLGSGARRTAGIDYAGGEVAYAVKNCDGDARIARSAPPLDRTLKTGCPRLKVKRARISGGRLLVSGKADPAFRGRLEVEYSLGIGKRTRFFSRTVEVRDGAFSFSARLPSWIGSKRADRTGDLDVSFAGDEVYEAASDSVELATPRRRVDD
jgi:hypothetical protein